MITEVIEGERAAVIPPEGEKFNLLYFTGVARTLKVKTSTNIVLFGLVLHWVKLE